MALADVIVVPPSCQDEEGGGPGQERAGAGGDSDSFTPRVRSNKKSVLILLGEQRIDNLAKDPDFILVTNLTRYISCLIT